MINPNQLTNPLIIQSDKTDDMTNDTTEDMTNDKKEESDNEGRSCGECPAIS